MASGTRVVWDPSFTSYDFGPGHPLTPVRLDLTARLADALGLLERPGVQVSGADVADDDLLATVHDPDYVAAVRRVSDDPTLTDLARGLGTDDDPVFAGMHEASARVATGSVECAEQVWRGEVAHGVNFCGGLHHAMPDRASGFCVYNDIALGIRRLLDLGARKVVYIDIDVHHGDGPQAIFWDDPRVLTISLHESGRMLFPGTGFPDELGGPHAIGSAANVALPPGTGDAGWLRAVHSVVPQLVRAFEPEVVVSQHGCDTHFLDPLAHMAVTIDAQRTAAAMIHALAHEVCDGRWVALGGGGYEVVDVVPRSWAHLVGIAVHAPVDPTTAVPEEWAAYVRSAFGRSAPGRMTDGRDSWWRSWEVGYDPDDQLDRAVMATRKAAFPLHGLDPYFD
ncbi:MAG TPA: acetoin utilization protein AcuC [Actinomycetales bacterium]|nr:acetoin utilization protein AcuC [Actinomycetales bacterium]